MPSKKKAKTKDVPVKTRRDLLVEYLDNWVKRFDELDEDHLVPDADELLEAIGADPNAPDPKVHPVANVRWVPLDKTQANNWNPNKVAPNEMRLLHLSISNDGYCVAADTPVLGADLQWHPAGDLRVGQELVAFDAERSGSGNEGARRFRTAEVMFNELREEELFRVRTDMGDVVTNAAHPWLGQRLSGSSEARTVRWLSTGELEPGDLLVRCLEPWTPDRSWEGGWLAGMLDGEGSMSRNETAGRSPLFRLAAYQRPGVTAERLREEIEARVEATFHRHVHDNDWSDMTMVRVDRLTEQMRLLGMVRPERLIAGAGHFWDGVSMQTKGSSRRAKVLGVDSIGPGVIASLATSTETFIANGFAMHNTQPVVTIYDEETERFVVVDGFHRRQTMLNFADIRESTGGRLPVVVIDKPINDRMASTVRHNRARGKHSVGGMGQIVFGMLEGGWSDEEICKQLGMEADELVRLKHVTGFAKLFEDVEYRRAWETRKQIKIRRAFKEGEATDAIEDDPEDLEAKALAEAEGEQVADV